MLLWCRTCCWAIIWMTRGKSICKKVEGTIRERGRLRQSFANTTTTEIYIWNIIKRAKPERENNKSKCSYKTFFFYNSSQCKTKHLTLWYHEAKRLQVSAAKYETVRLTLVLSLRWTSHIDTKYYKHDKKTLTQTM